MNISNPRQNIRTPLLRLIELDKHRHGNNKRLRELISLASEIVQIPADDIRRDTFDQPNESSFTYSVLFDDWSQTLKLRQTTVEQLLTQLTTWEEKGLCVGEITKWKNYSHSEHQVACRIWKHICQIAGKELDLDGFIKLEEDHMHAKLRTKDEITACLTTYCADAQDQQTYFEHLEDMDKRFESQFVRSINVPEEIQTLIPQVARLNSFSECTVWLKFYEERRDRKFVQKNEDEQDRRTCTVLLRQADEIFELFIGELKSICDNWRTSPISRLIHLFPDSNYIDHDLKTLEPLLLDSVAVPILEDVLHYWKSRERFRHICQGCINLLTHLQLPISQKTQILTKMFKINEDTSGEIFHQVYEYFRRKFLKRHSLELQNILAHYSSSDDLLKFLHSLNLIDANNLLEAVNDWDESLVNTKTVMDFVLIRTFLDQTYARIDLVRQATLGFDQIINCFDDVLNGADFKNILSCFESCSKSLSSIQRVHLDFTNKEQSKRQRILEIMQKASLIFINQSLKSSAATEHQFDVNIDNQLGALEDLSELRERARLIEYSNDKMKDDSEEEIANLRLFVSLVDLIEVILERLTSLYVCGHPYVSDDFAPFKEFRCEAKDYQGVQEFSIKLEKLLIKWQSHLCQMYEEYFELTYFTYNQVWLVEHYLFNQNSAMKNDPAYHLLKFIGIEPDAIEMHRSSEEKKSPSERFEQIGRILAAHRVCPNPRIKRETKLSEKVLLTQTSDEGVMRAILSFFRLNHLQGRANQLFYCTEKTTWMEIRGFIYRCFYSQIFHQLIRPERLTSLIQDQFIRLLRQLLKDHPRQHLQLGIITTVPIAHTQIINSLETLGILYIYHDQDLLNLSQMQEVVQKYLGNNVLLVTSRIAGLGKSTFIRDTILEMNKQYIKFPINGDFHIDTLAERIVSYGTKLASSASALHIDIGVIDNPHQLNELLYCLLLLRSFRFGQVAVHIPSDVPIYIELDASPTTINLSEKIIIFKYLKTFNIDSIDWKELKPEKLPGIQWVVNYLQSIEDQTINKKDINQTTIQSLPTELCCRLLEKYISREKKSEFLTWTKVAIFVAVYSSLFFGFSRCGHFLVESVQWLRVPELRKDILLSLMESSDQFTSLSVEAVRKNQRSTNELAVVDFSEAIIRWDKLQAFTLVFTATDDPVFVYKKAKDIPKSLLAAFAARSGSGFDFRRARQLSRQQSQSLLPDYTNLTHVQFFVKLASLSRKYFNKSICLKCFKQHEYIEEQCQKCLTNDTLVRPQSWETNDIATFQEMIAIKLQEDYVLTPDNYTKMLLIYLRVQSGLPVLIMGETGQIHSNREPSL